MSLKNHFCDGLAFGGLKFCLVARPKARSLLPSPRGCGGAFCFPTMRWTPPPLAPCLQVLQGPADLPAAAPPSTHILWPPWALPCLYPPTPGCGTQSIPHHSGLFPWLATLVPHPTFEIQRGSLTCLTNEVRTVVSCITQVWGWPYISPWLRGSPHHWGHLQSSPRLVGQVGVGPLRWGRGAFFAPAEARLVPLIL